MPARAQMKAVLAALVFLPVVITGFGAELPRRILSGHTVSATSRLTPRARLFATNELSLAIGLPLRNAAGLDEFLNQLYDPASTNFHKFLTPPEFAARFGPTESDYSAVIKFVESRGLKVTYTHPNRLVLDVVGDVAHIEDSFRVTLNRYAHPKEKRDFFSPASEPSVPADLNVSGISGLNNFSLPRPNSKITPLPAVSKRVVPNAGSGPGSGYMGGDFRAAYVPGVPLTGAGQSVALLQFDGYVSNDIAAYISLAGLGSYPISLTNVPVNGGVSVPGAGNGEVCLDIEMVLSMAPGVSKIYVYEGPNGSTSWSTILSRIANDNLAKQVSCSWGGGATDSGVNAIFKQMAAQGQSFFCASGDYDAYTTSVPFLLDNTNITLVGGTVLTTANAGGAYVSETVWNDRTVNANGGNWGSSGGVSPTYAIPAWQAGMNMSTNLGSTTLRNLPDVALTGKNCFIVADTNQLEIAGGTSCAAPLWAGFMALANEQAATAGRSPVGFLNPSIYSIGNGTYYTNCLHDITSGDNYWSGSPLKYPAVAGFDLCTGWGSPIGQPLMDALVGVSEPLGVLPDTGFIMANGPAGGPFASASQNVMLTNFSVAPLAWSIINTSAWLTVSASSGTLAVTGQASVVVSVNVTANTFSSGIYFDTLIFSNQASGIFQSRQFNLQVFEPLQLLTTNGLTIFGMAGGPFNPSAQSVVFTNQVAVSQNWSLINTSSWLAVSASSGVIAGNGSVSVTVSTNAGTVALANGTYTATMLLSNQSSHVVQSLIFSARVGQSLVQNGGFETGDFTAWTLSGSSGSFTVSSSATYAHSGVYGFKATANSLGYIAQNLPTVPGQTYQLSFWFFVTATRNGQLFQANWNGTNIFSSSSPPTSWSNQKFIVTATSTNTQIQFGLNSASSSTRSFGLDDISVTPVNLPAITQQPSSQTNFAGSNVVFTAAASGSAPLSYQWRTNGVNLAGVNTDTFSLTAVTTNNSGNYTLVVTNFYGSVTSSIATLTVVLPPSITSSTLTNRTAECGKNTNTFTLAAIGTAPLAIQWSLNNTPVTGATNTSFSLMNLAVSVNPISVTVTNRYGVATSNATLTIQDTLPPVFVSQPQSRTNFVGTTANFSVAVTACTALSYQWFFNSAPLTARTNISLSLSNLTTAAAGNYFAVASAAGGSSTSVVATLTVNLNPTSVALASSANPDGFKDSLNFIAAVTPTNATGTIQFLTNGSAFDLKLLITGAATSTNLSTLPRGTNFITAIYSGDAGDLPATNTLSQIVTNHPPQVAPAFYMLFAGTDLTIAVASLATNWSDADGDLLSLAFIYPSTNGVAVTNTLPNLFYSNPNYVSDQFVCAISDGFGGTNFQAVNITVVPQTNATPVISSVGAPSSGGISLQLNGAYGSTYVLESASDLTAGNWQPVATNTLSVAGVWQFTDFGVTNNPVHFYRLKLVP